MQIIGDYWQRRTNRVEAGATQEMEETCVGSLGRDVSWSRK